MCGIAGQVSFSENLLKYKSSFLKMEDSLKNRGPDQHGEYFSNSAALVHRRLAVIDIENGCQPMIYETEKEKYIIAYNGELYNTQEVKNELLSHGVEFRGHSDTEVVLKAFAEFGEYAVNMFNGIYAFAIWQEKKQELFFARDRMGVKPLFFAKVKSGFVFASELKAMLCHPEIEPVMDINSLSEIMLIGPGRTPGCGVFKGIEEIKPAFCGTYSHDGLKL